MGALLFFVALILILGGIGWVGGFIGDHASDWLTSFTDAATMAAVWVGFGGAALSSMLVGWRLAHLLHRLKGPVEASQT
jgi:hypothetical protein